MTIWLFNILLAITSLLVAKLSAFEVCNVKNQDCLKNATSEYEIWDCYGKYIFRPKSNKKSENTYVEHDCGGVGWGNSMRALYNAFGLAALMDRRLIVRFVTLTKVWNPPYGLKSWDYGEKQSAYFSGHDSSKQYAIFDFEKYGREDRQFDAFVANLSIPHSDARYEKTKNLNSGVCGGSPNFILKGDCTSKILSNFGRCANPARLPSGEDSHVSEQQLLVPFYYMTFSNPTKFMVEKLNAIRDRLTLPRLEPGVEPKAGLYGLFTPGYYIFALHFRRVPLGFEPLSVEVNENKGVTWKTNMLKAYWNHVTKFAQKAKQIAECRKEILLIYFATDDIHNLRSEAEKHLSEFGRVVFGLTVDEVGHVIPQWQPQDEVKITKTAMELKKKGYTKDAMIGLAKPKKLKKKSAELVQTETSVTGEISSVAAELINQYDKSPEATQRHGAMALVEWWILANSNWLVSHSGTSYSDTAAGWGFGPHGHLERLDIIYDKNNFATTFRKDWNTPNCTPMYSYDSQQSETCPNKKD